MAQDFDIGDCVSMLGIKILQVDTWEDACIDHWWVCVNIEFRRWGGDFGCSSVNSNATGFQYSRLQTLP